MYKKKLKIDIIFIYDHKRQIKILNKNIQFQFHVPKIKNTKNQYPLLHKK